ncbi:TIGR03767 family metallophosphoesterase [Streptomyces meridianus]|uniref:TIGR03767 family metallophosphoesterase n=1 Tax=Streptomyces meridianus TaxID=2938945 RepID=A0ABT0X248_9ACTN|nr:TIGR03767 family metallophosphoesterase [Streptomyces meridianus]MCM2575988.1 TIGR03767 family metallophosphoesterase [Streptomyces meridianus]
MSRTGHVASGPDRRTVLAALGTAGVSAGISAALGPGGRRADAAPARPRRILRVADPAPSPAGTTLESVAIPTGSGSYRRITDGPGWPRVVRQELAAAKEGREDRRSTLAAFVQFTDLHLVDVQHPLRYEYVRPQTGSAWRPQEALTVAGAVSLVERVNRLSGAPATGEPVSFVMTTGDNTDNNSRAELDWYLSVMSGGRITPDTGDPRRYEGVQNGGSDLYWQADSDQRDADKRLGFPRIHGYLDAAIRTVVSPGLNVPWYSTVGNHDSLPGGCWAPGDPFFADFAVGGRKLEALPEAEGAALWRAVEKGLDPKGEQFKEVLRANARKMRTVTPDPRRAPFTPHEYLRAHLDPRYTGAGPVGHGYTADHLEDGRMYYTFPVAEGVIGVSLDTTDPGGHYQGSVGTAQLRWLERALARHRDDRVLVFSHHTSTSMKNPRPDPSRPGEKRHTGDELLALLTNHGNVLAWINGHSHRNEIRAHGGLWEISTASHIDFPQLARVFELVDNGDGTLSLFTTLIESAAPHRTDVTDLSQTGLAALYRELSLNDPAARDDLAGGPADRNTELLLKQR